MSWLILSLYVLATSSGLVLLKLGTKAGLPVSYLDNRWHFNLNAFTVGGIFLYGVSFLLYMYLVSKNDLGYIIPLTTAFVYIAIFIASFLIFKEVYTTPKIMGIALILIGLVLLNRR